MKRPVLLFSLITVLAFTADAQDKGWSFGLDYNPFFYWNYNKKDWNNLPESYPVEPRTFNGLRVGITAEKYYKKFGIQAITAYSSQIQNHLITNSFRSENGEIVEQIYDTKYTRHINYMHVNIYLNKSFGIGYSSRFYLNISFGVINSLLTNFKTIHTNFEVNSGEITNQIEVKTINDNNTGYQLIHPGTEDERHNTYNLPRIYSTYMIGISSQISLSRLVGNHYIIEMGVRGDYDITNSENKNHADRIWYRLGGGATQDDDGNWNYEPRSPSYNIRLGPFLALRYRF